jgi:hypothetical protein
MYWDILEKNNPYQVTSDWIGHEIIQNLPALQVQAWQKDVFDRTSGSSGLVHPL